MPIPVVIHDLFRNKNGTTIDVMLIMRDSPERVPPGFALNLSNSTTRSFVIKRANVFNAYAIIDYRPSGEIMIFMFIGDFGAGFISVGRRQFLVRDHIVVFRV